MTIQDRKAGFPASWLGKTLANGVTLSISNDQTLLVSNPRISFNQRVDYWDTRDVVAIIDDRVFFKGRADTLINVGGLKVFPEEVEAHLLKLPQISDVLVSSQPNPITGQILIAEIVPNGLIESALLRNQIEDHLRELPRHARPALLRFKAQLSNVRTGKKSRLQ
jgi:acyl-coenzyme A synthetase/AMP-(fatty) acid ligase